MSLDQSDKTVFRQPMPGGFKRTPNEQAPWGNTTQLKTPEQAAPKEIDLLPISSERLNINPIVHLAEAIFKKLRKVKLNPTIIEADIIHSDFVTMLKSYDAKLREKSVSEEKIGLTKYFLCAVIDEVMLNLPADSHGKWSNRTLLSLFYADTTGGRKSFLIFEKIRKRPNENIDIIELFYLCICTGYEGQYRLIPNGKIALLELKEDMFRILSTYRKYDFSNLSNNAIQHVETTTASTSFNYALLAIPVSMLLLAILYFYNQSRLSEIANKISSLSI